MGGLEVSQALPPTGWSPISGTDADLDFYGFPRRPTDPQQLAAWQDEFSAAHFSGVTPLGPNDLCQMNDRSAGTAGLGPTVAPVLDGGNASPAGSSNWAGVVDVASGLDYIFGRMYEDSSANCAGTDSHLTWVGIGGYGKGTALLQNGTAQEGALGNDFAWYEALNSSHDTHIVSIGGAFPIGSGDEIALSTRWTGGSSAHVTFFWHNLANSTAVTLSIGDKAVAGEISDYHDGHSAEAVDEREGRAADSAHSNNPWLTKLRQHSPTRWHGVITESGGTSQPIRVRNHVTVTMTNNSGNTTLEKPDVGSSTKTNFIDNWAACGAEEQQIQ